jgi:hypothetical protein
LIFWVRFVVVVALFFLVTLWLPPCCVEAEPMLYFYFYLYLYCLEALGAFGFYSFPVLSCRFFLFRMIGRFFFCVCRRYYGSLYRGHVGVCGSVMLVIMCDSNVWRLSGPVMFFSRVHKWEYYFKLSRRLWHLTGVLSVIAG